MKINNKIQFFFSVFFWQPLKIFLVAVLVLGWVFSGWPRIRQNPPFPPDIQEARATAPIPAYRASGTFTAGTGAITPPYPAGMVANDICLLAVTSENQAISLTTANGFVEIPTWSPQSAGTAATDPGSRLAVFWKRTVGGDSAPVVADSINNTEGVIHCFSGVIASGNPWDTGAGGNDSAANDTTGTIPGSTTTVDNTLVVLIISTSVNGTGTTNFSSWTNANLANILERQDNSNTAGLGGGSGMATGEKATAGAYTTTTVTLAATSYKGAISLALKPPQLPTVTSPTAISVTSTGATLGANVTNDGGGAITARGTCWATTATPTTNCVAEGGTTTGVFTHARTGISSGTLIYYRGYATNSAGTSYSADGTFTTSPAAPTGVAATDGTYTDKVTITWTKSTGATDYHVWRDSTDLGAAGDVATFDDTGAGAPTVTAGTASASDGSATDKVTLSISGASANNGTSYTYKVVASNATGNSADSTTDTGYRAPGALTYQWYRSSGDADSGYSILSGATTAPYDDTTAPAPTITPGAAIASDGTSVVHVALSISGQSANVGAGRYFYATVSATGASSADTNHDRGYIGVGSLTYQWQRSAADSDVSYSDIVGATTASYNDTAAPADGSGRYYKVVENATGATQQISTADRGYRAVAVVSVSVSDGVVIYGTMVAGTSKTTINLTDTQTLTNDGNVTEIFNIKGQNAACPWTLAATAGTDQYVHEFCKATDVSCASPPTNYTALTTSYQTLYTGVPASGTRQLDLRVTPPTASSCFTSQAVDVTVQATQ